MLTFAVKMVKLRASSEFLSCCRTRRFDGKSIQFLLQYGQVLIFSLSSTSLAILLIKLLYSVSNIYDRTIRASSPQVAFASFSISFFGKNNIVKVVFKRVKFVQYFISCGSRNTSQLYFSPYISFPFGKNCIVILLISATL